MPTNDDYGYLGIDPGKNGGLCFVNPEGGIKLAAMPPVDDEIRLLQWLLDIPRPFRAYVEKVGGWMGKHKKADGENAAHDGSPGSSMFNFGWSYGAIRMGLKAIGLTEGYDLFFVHPRTWQPALGLHKLPGMTKSQFKSKILKPAAQLVFPSEKITLKTADAVLIMEYGRKQNQLG